MSEFSEVDEFIEKDDSRIALLFEQVIPLEKYEEYYNLCSRNQNIYFIELFSRFRLVSVLPHKSSDHFHNMGKNRYGDIVTSDKYRVYLWDNESQKKEVEEKEEASLKDANRKLSEEPESTNSLPCESEDFGKIFKSEADLLNRDSNLELFHSNSMSLDARSSDIAKVDILASMENSTASSAMTVNEAKFYVASSRDVRLASFQGFINATYIGGAYDNREYIATQGPLDSTIDDFYLMIWQQECKAIVMLCCVMEAMREKCADYLPSFKRPVICNYNGVLVELIKSRSVTEHLKASIIKMSTDSEVRFVTHYHYSGWPDRGVPTTESSFESVILLQQLLMWTQDEEYSKPVVVHCSAGVGRTGTFIAFDTNVKRLLDGANSISVCPFICRMRKARPHMVQTDEQFVFIHKLVLRHVHTTYMELDYAKFFTELEVALSDRKGKIVNAYWKPFALSDDLKNDQDDCELPSEVDILAYLRNLYFSEYKWEFLEIESFVEGKTFFTAYNPSVSCAEGFIRRIIENQVKVVVYIGEDSDCFNYYGDRVTIGEYDIETKTSKVSNNCSYREMDIICKQKEYRVLHCQFPFFNKLDKNATDFEKTDIMLSSFILNSYKIWAATSETDGPSLLIHSNNPEEETAVVVLCLLLMQNIEVTGGQVDIARTLNKLRLYLPRCFPNLEDLLVALKCLCVVLNPT